MKKHDMHLSVPDEVIKEIDLDVSRGKFYNRTDAIIQHVRFALAVKENLTRLEDPDIVKKLRDSWQNKRLDEMILSLSDNERRYLSMYFELQKWENKIC